MVTAKSSLAVVREDVVLVFTQHTLRVPYHMYKREVSAELLKTAGLDPALAAVSSCSIPRIVDHLCRTEVQSMMVDYTKGFNVCSLRKLKKLYLLVVVDPSILHHPHALAKLQFLRTTLNSER